MLDVKEATLAQWEEVYKRGLLTFWILLLLSEQEMYAYQMGASIADLSQGSIDVDDNSIYRALRRFAEAGLVTSSKKPSDSGPPRRYFSISSTGLDLLASFIERNLLIFQNPPVKDAMTRILRIRNEKEKDQNGSK